MIGSSGLKILPVDNLDEAARYVEQVELFSHSIVTFQTLL